ncbi:class I SAM-dependent methyltransferase [Desulfothermus sp.]
MISTTEWMDGYVSDVSYTANFYHYQVPDFLNVCILLKGFDPPDIKKGFNYLELGSGMGFNLNLISSLYPEGNFFGVDFNPEHICFSEKIKNLAQLKNVHFFELSFEEMLKEKLNEFPMFDYITLHGVFSWISHENRINAVKIIRQKLKPGGVCYISYNDMCGWWRQVPLQKFLVDFSKMFPDIGSISQISIGLNLIKKMQKFKLGYFNMPFVNKLLKKHEAKAKEYLVHEYLNQDWKPLFFSEILSYMSESKTKYITQAEPIWEMEKIYLNDEQLKFIQEQRSSVLREILKDYLIEMSFRKDIYIKGATRIPVKKWKKKLEEIQVALRIVPTEKKYKIEIPFCNKNANIAPKTVDRLIEILTEKSCSIGNLLKDRILGYNQLNEIIPFLALLHNTRLIDFFINETQNNRESSIRLNKVVAKDSRYRNIIKFFSAPISKSGIAVNLIERLVYDVIVNREIKDVEEIVSCVYNNLIEVANIEKQKKEDIEKDVLNCIENTVPQWTRMGIIELNL